MKVFVTSLFLFIAIAAQGQNLSYKFPSELWHKGEVTLSDGSLLKGNVKYSLEEDYIQVNVNSQIQTLAANQLRMVRIYQEDISRYRVFYAIPFKNKYGYKRPQLFELVFEGETSLLARERILLTTTRTNDPFFRGGWGYNPYAMPRSTKILEHELFIINPKGKISQLTTNRNDVIYAFDGQHAQLRKIIKSQKLKMSRIDDLITLVDEYNKLGEF